MMLPSPVCHINEHSVQQQHTCGILDISLIMQQEAECSNHMYSDMLALTIQGINTQQAQLASMCLATAGVAESHMAG